MDAGLTWQKVYLPKDAPLPSGNDLSAQVRALKSVAASGLVIADPAGIVAFSRKKPDTQAAVPADMRLVYLVTDEAVRAQRLAAKAAEPPRPRTQPGRPAASMQNAAAAFSQMTPDEQRQALPLMFQQFRAIMQSMDPSVRQGLRQQFGGRRGGLRAERSWKRPVTRLFFLALVCCLALGLLTPRVCADPIILRVGGAGGFKLPDKNATDPKSHADRAIVEAFERAHPEIRLERAQGVTIGGPAAESNLLLEFAGGTAPDVVYCQLSLLGVVH